MNPDFLYILGIVNAWRRKDWGRALVQPKGVAGLIMYWSLLGLAISARVAREPPKAEPAPTQAPSSEERRV